MAESFPTPITTINLDEEFPHLTRAPIVESVIDFRARAEAPWEEPDVTAKLKAALPDYPKVKAFRGFSLSFPIEFTMGPVQSTTPTPAAPVTPQDRGWVGLRFESADGLNLATFGRDGFSFSRLKPYQDWARFSAEALRLWAVHAKLAAPSEIQRFGVRVINRLEVPIAGLAFDEYFEGIPGPPGNLGSSHFMYQDLLSVPGHPYGINLIRTFQPPEGEAASTLALLLDIDVFCPGPMALESGKITDRLAQMHWLKNRVFFGSVTEKALSLCR